MKKRNGFISNSSSCSFIVSLKEFPTTIDLADYMIDCRYEYKKEYYKEGIEYVKSHPNVTNESVEEYESLLKNNEETHKKLKQNLLQIVSVSNAINMPSPNLAFKSVNFDTFIKEIEVEGKKYFYVSTCNNVSWDIPTVVPSEKTGMSEPDHLFNGGDLYDGLWDEAYIQGESFTCIDTNQFITIKDRFNGLNQET